MTTHQIIKDAIEFYQSKIKLLEERLNTVKDEPETKICPHCGTSNLSYHVTLNMWFCAYCGKVDV